MNRKAFYAIVYAVTAPMAAYAQCSIGQNPVKIDGAAGFRSPRLAVDADGAPNSYLVDGNGLSRTCDGVEAIVNGHVIPTNHDPQNKLCKQAWAAAQVSGDYSKLRIFGFLAGNGNKPIVQGESDPLPGKAFVTTTSLSVPGSKATEQRHWVDANKIPYFILSNGIVGRFGISPGDVGVIYVPKTKAFAFGVYGDENGTVGEASVKMHEDLGGKPIVKDKAGIERASANIETSVVTLVFPGQHTDATTDSDAWNKQIQSVGAAAFAKWGGLDKLKACAP